MNGMFHWKYKAKKKLFGINSVRVLRTDGMIDKQI